MDPFVISQYNICCSEIKETLDQNTVLKNRDISKVTFMQSPLKSSICIQPLYKHCLLVVLPYVSPPLYRALYDDTLLKSLYSPRKKKKTHIADDTRWNLCQRLPIEASNFMSCGSIIHILSDLSIS